MSFPQREILEQAVVRKKLTRPHIPGLLSFREIPAPSSAFQALETEPDLIIADGQGIAHPQRLGIGVHLGLLLDKPTICNAVSGIPCRNRSGWPARRPAPVKRAAHISL